MTIVRSAVQILRVLPLFAGVTLWAQDATPTPLPNTVPTSLSSSSEICLNPPPPPKTCSGCWWCDLTTGVWTWITCNFKNSRIVSASLDYTHTGEDYRVFTGGEAAGCQTCKQAPTASDGLPTLQFTRYHRLCPATKCSGVSPL
jgi:hypothetical protein